MASELNEQSTTEEVVQAVDDIAKERESEQTPPDENKDSRISAKMTEIEQETTVGDDETADVEDTGETAETWFDDDVKAAAAAYGIEESDLADFASREEYERATRLFDKSALEAGRKALAESEEKEKPRNEQGRFEKKADPEPKEGAYEVSLSKDLYDEEIVSEFGRMRDHYESKVSSLESKLDEVLNQFAEQQSVAEEQQFDAAVDSLGHADLFGKNGRESTKQLERRRDLYVAVKAQMIGLEQLGRPAELDESLVGRVAKMVFAEDLGKKELKNRTRKISNQSNGRQGGGATRPTDPPEDPREEADRRYKELEGA